MTELETYKAFMLLRAQAVLIDKIKIAAVNLDAKRITELGVEVAKFKRLYPQYKSFTAMEELINWVKEHLE